MFLRYVTTPTSRPICALFISSHLISTLHWIVNLVYSHAHQSYDHHLLIILPIQVNAQLDTAPAAVLQRAPTAGLSAVAANAIKVRRLFSPATGRYEASVESDLSGKH